MPLVGNDDVLVETREAFSGDGDGVKAIVQAHAKASDMVRVLQLPWEPSSALFR